MNDLLQRPAGELARLVRDGDVAAVELVDAFAEVVGGLEPALNAMVADRLDHARHEAAAIDADIARGDDAGPLAGVPFAVSENLALRNAPWGAGSVARCTFVGDRDATAVARLRAAGAVPVCVSNVSELGFWIETDNRVHGRTRNPWDPSRTAGGACGGAAALTAAGAVPFALGGGSLASVRLPAALSGACGHRPSSGMVPLTGLYPMPYGRARRYACVGPITAHACDLPLVLSAIAGDDGIDHAAAPVPLLDADAVDFTWKRVIVCEDPSMRGISPTRDVEKAVLRAARALDDAGGEVEHWRPEPFRRAADLWLALTHESYGLTSSFAEVVGEGERFSAMSELVRAGIGRSRHTAPTMLMSLVERATKGSYARIQRLCAEGRRLRARLQAMLADGGVLLLPAFPRVAPRHGTTLRRPMEFTYSALFNVLELPATVVPMGFTRDGLPLSVQIVAAHGRDDVCFAAARIIETAGGGRVPPRRSKRR